MTKRILFILPSLGIGGTIVSVRNLISLLEKQGYDCRAMALYPKGVLQHLYDDVKMIATPFVIQAFSIGSWKYEKNIFKKVIIAILRITRKLNKTIEKKWVGKLLDKTIKEYKIDTIIASQEAISTRFVAYALTKNKLAWVRCDYKRMLEDTGRSRDSYYDGYKAIVCVSEKTTETFKEIFPEHVDKTFCIPNPQDESLILSRADNVEEDSLFIQNGYTFVSIGRLDSVKRFDQIPFIAKKLLDKGLHFKWFIIGDGEEKQKIENAIKECNVSNCVIMLGAKTNPFYYIKRADALICLSRSEACPRVINEAKILHTPTVSTDFPTVYEFIQDGETGIISTLEKIPDAIYSLLNDVNLNNHIKNNIEKFSFDNTLLLDRINSIL